MLVIRLARTGRKKYPTYRIVAADSQRAATGKFVMILGHYNPHSKELVIKHEETIKYLANGAQPSNAVVKLLKQDKIDVPEWVTLKTRNRPAKKEAPITAAPASEAAAETALEADSQEAASVEAADVPTAAEETAAPAESIAEVAEAEVEAVAENAPVENKAETAAEVEAEVKTAKAAEDAAAESPSDTQA